MFITIIGFKNYHGLKPFKIDSILKLRKEPENFYDSEAIAVEMRHAGQVGYVANSTNTVVKGTMSAGRVFDKIMDDDFAQVKFIANSLIIAKILGNDEIEKLKKDPENDINFLVGD